MDVAESATKETQSVLDETTEQEYASQSKLLLEFLNIPSFDRAWCFQSANGQGSDAMFVINQPSILANKKRKSLLSTHIVREGNDSDSVKFCWAPFPVELTGVSALAPSPSGSKLLVVRNSENVHFEIWGSAELKKDFAVPSSIHGSVYSDGWFEGISWSFDETLVAYVAEEPDSTKPKFNCSIYAEDGKDCGSWKGVGDWEEDWGESYAGKRQPAIFVIDVESGEVCPVAVERSLSVGQVVWAPSVEGQKYLVFVGWPSKRKFGIKYCYNRPCALYAVKAPSFKSKISRTANDEDEDLHLVNLTQSISSAFFPRFSPDDKSLVFVSAKSAVDSGAHMATDSLHKIDWPSDGNLDQSFKIIDVVPVVMCPENESFPGIYCTDILSNPWLSDGHTMILSSVWGSAQAIVSINVLSGEISRISPKDSYSSWNALALKDDDIIAECSSPVDIPQIKYGSFTGKKLEEASWNWLDVLHPLKCSETAMSRLASMKFRVMKIPVTGISENLTKGASNQYEAIYVSSPYQNSTANDPLIVILHGGPHDVALTSFSKTSAFLCSLGFNLLIVNYRGSWGFGEEALQSLPGKVGTQDVNDVLTAIDHVIDKGLADPSKIAVVGISHGGFLATHLIGQAPGKFAAAAARNPVCNFALMVGTSDIPDWCFINVYGDKGKANFSQSPSAEHLAMFYSKSPISHISKVKTPTIFLLGARDVRVPMYDGLQYARALREKGVETKVIVFPNDIHPINRPQSDFESFLEIGIWFKKHCK